jgi:hypothetical protein
MFLIKAYLPAVALFGMGVYYFLASALFGSGRPWKTWVKLAVLGEGAFAVGGIMLAASGKHLSFAPLARRAASLMAGITMGPIDATLAMVAGIAPFLLQLQCKVSSPWSFC